MWEITEEKNVCWLSTKSFLPFSFPTTLIKLNECWLQTVYLWMLGCQNLEHSGFVFTVSWRVLSFGILLTLYKYIHFERDSRGALQTNQPTLFLAASWMSELDIRPTKTISHFSEILIVSVFLSLTPRMYRMAIIHHHHTARFITFSLLHNSWWTCVFSIFNSWTCPPHWKRSCNFPCGITSTDKLSKVADCPISFVSTLILWNIVIYLTHCIGFSLKPGRNTN